VVIKPLRDSLPWRPDGLILAGGQAKRFSGEEKGLIEFNGQPMVAQVAGVFRGKVRRLMISANRNQSRYLNYADQVVADRIGEEWGPLAGIYTGLTITTADWLLVATCDQPLLPANYAERMVEHIAGNSKSIVVAVDAEREHFLNLLLPVSSAEFLHDFLVSGKRRVRSWLEIVGYRKVEFPDGCLDSVNSPAQLKSLERRSNEDKPG